MLALALSACSGGSDDSADGALGAVTGTLPFEESDFEQPPQNTGPAIDLAPSQIAASTVPTPSIPGPCELADLEFWTAQVMLGESSADAVIRVRNVGAEWCEPDISESPLIDPRIEPDVWLERGGSADLVVGQRGDACAEPSAVTLAQIVVAGESTAVPTAALACEWWLTAFYPTEPAADACVPDDLDTAVVSGGVVLRNRSFQSCALGPLVEVDGEEPLPEPATEPGVPRVSDLMPRDVVMFGRTGSTCDADPRPVTLVFEAAGGVTVDDVPCEIVFEFGSGRAWFGAPDGPDLGAGPIAVDDVFALLDPFAGIDS